MDFSSIVKASLEYFQNFDGAKALQVAYYFVALVLASFWPVFFWGLRYLAR